MTKIEIELEELTKDQLIGLLTARVEKKERQRAMSPYNEFIGRKLKEYSVAGYERKDAFRAAVAEWQEQKGETPLPAKKTRRKRGTRRSMSDIAHRIKQYLLATRRRTKWATMCRKFKIEGGSASAAKKLLMHDKDIKFNGTRRLLYIELNEVIV